VILRLLKLPCLELFVPARKQPLHELLVLLSQHRVLVQQPLLLLEFLALVLMLVLMLLVLLS